jgi:Spy/CpxP family protein refolding chaperone
MIMRIRSILSFSLPLMLAVPSLGCGGSVSAEPAATATSAATKAPVAQSAHGPLKLIGDAFGDVPLTTSQRAEIESLATDAEARHATARAAGKDLMTALAAQVEAGALHRELLQPKIDALVTALVAAQPADRAAFQKLHDILQPDQRVTFVDAFEARVGERMHAGAESGEGRGAHPLRQWAVDLGLSDEQKAQIRAALAAERSNDDGARGEHKGGPGGWAQWKDAGRQGGRMLESFKQDRFVIDEVAPARDIPSAAARASDRFLKMAEAALPVLTPQQRAIAAQKLRDRVEGADVVGPASL